MGLFDDAMDTEQPAQLTKEVGFLGILMLADYSDGSVSADEVRAFGNTISRMKLYRNMTEQQVNRHIDHALKIIKQAGFDEALKKFAAVVPEKLHKSVFANACNQVLADGVVEEEEKKFINDLRRALDLSGDDAQMIAQVMVYKNQG